MRMKLKCQDDRQWHRRFAYFPVDMGNLNEVIWLEYYECRLVSAFMGAETWEYRHVANAGGEAK